MIKSVKIDDNYLLSLCAILQSVSLINKIATTDFNATQDSKFLIDSIYIKNELNAISIYKNKSELFEGYMLLKNILLGKNEIPLITMQKYVLNILLIQKNINKNKSLMELIRKKIDNYQENSIISKNLNNQVLYSEEIYKEYIGIIRPRVIISGKKEYLDKNSSLIRALLLSGIRAAFLWSYYGGNKWQLMFKRKEILNKCNSFFI